jgi:hypothetical protein
MTMRSSDRPGRSWPQLTLARERAVENVGGAWAAQQVMGDWLSRFLKKTARDDVIVTIACGAQHPGTCLGCRGEEECWESARGACSMGPVR